MYLRISCYCDACLNSSDLRVGVTTLLNTIQYSQPGAQPALHFGGTIFMKFHSMTSPCLFNRSTTFSQTVTYNNNVFLPADTKSIVQAHTFCTTLVNKNRQNRTFYNSVEGWITGFKRNFSLAKFLTSRHVRMHRATFNISIRWENRWLGH